MKISQQNRFSAKPIFASLYFALTSTAFGAICDYEVVDEWNNGFKVEVTISNQIDPAFSEWQVSWPMEEGTTINNSWNASFNCSQNECVITPPAWQPVIAQGQSYKFGFVANKQSGDTPRNVVITGDICDSNSSMPGSGNWLLDEAQSSLHYVSTKNEHNSEINEFEAQSSDVPALQGMINEDGEALLKIRLDSINSGVDIRNQRLRNILFKTELLPDAWFNLQLEPEFLASLKIGKPQVSDISGELSLHAIRLELSANVMVTRLSEQQLTVSNIKPVIINSQSFELDTGIESLRNVANLVSISETVPVYFQLVFNAETDGSSEHLTMPTAPAAPSDLSANFNTADITAQLNWSDNSNNETGFVVRRQAASGRWQTAAELSANVSQINEGLPDEGQYNYKVIAINQGVPSQISNIATIEVTQGNPIVRGRQTFMTDCAGCHGVNGEGIGNIPALNTEQDLETLIATITNTMPFGNPGACDRQCAEDVAAFIETLWVTELTCNTSVTPVTYGARQLKILTRDEYQNSVEDLLAVDFDVMSGLSADSKIGFFDNNTHTSVVASSYSNFLLVAEEVAQWSADRNFVGALTCDSVNQTCAQQLVSDLAPKIFRRPLDNEEQTTWLSIATGGQTNGDIKGGMQLALEGLLSSPQFIYRHELGEPNPNNPSLDQDAYELTSWEMATFLSYTFTGTVPDAQLREAAANNQLRDPENIATHAKRLATNSHIVLEKFVGSWLGTKDLEVAAKDPQVWPGFAELVPHMQEELNRNFSHVMLQPEEQFASLYAGNFSWLNQTLAQHYGIDGVNGDEFRMVTTSDRGGILASGAFMARWGESVETSPILRSVRVRRRMLCQDQPDPPAGTFEAREAKLAELSEFLQAPSTTNRDKYHRLTEDSPCTNCHTQYINPLGFGMEDFDTVGRVRTADSRGNPVDATGQLFAPLRYSDIDQFLPFIGAKGLGTLLADLSSAQACLPKQVFRFVTGVGHDEIDASQPDGPTLTDTEKAGYICEVDNLTDIMMTDSPRAMLEAVATMDAVRYRKAWSRENSQNF